MSETKLIKVAVFVHASRTGRDAYMAYTRDYNPEWPGCNIIEVEAKNGDCAKRLAIKEVKRRLMAGEPVAIDRMSVRI